MEGIYQKFLEMVKNGTEQEVRDFLVNNLKQFPQDMQEYIVAAFFEEALEKKAAVGELQQQGLEMNANMEKLRKELEKKAKLAEIKEGL